MEPDRSQVLVQRVDRIDGEVDETGNAQYCTGDRAVGFDREHLDSMALRQAIDQYDLMVKSALHAADSEIAPTHPVCCAWQLSRCISDNQNNNYLWCIREMMVWPGQVHLLNAMKNTSAAWFFVEELPR